MGVKLNWFIKNFRQKYFKTELPTVWKNLRHQIDKRIKNNNIGTKFEMILNNRSWENIYLNGCHLF